MTKLFAVIAMIAILTAAIRVQAVPAKISVQCNESQCLISEEDLKMLVESNLRGVQVVTDLKAALRKCTSKNET